MNKIINEDINIIKRSFGDILSKLSYCSVLITGACGMITSYLAYLLIDNPNIDLYLQCRNLKKAEKLYGEFLDNPHVHLSDMDLCKPIDDKFHFDYIIHGASPAGTEHFVKNPVGVIEPNVFGTKHLLDYSTKNHVKKFVFLSSNSVYGVSSKKCLNEMDYGVVDPLGLRSCYIESKRLGEQLCAAYSRQLHVDTSIVRICHTYGPTFDIENDTRAIPRFIRTILADENIMIYKDPNSVIQYTYVADIATSILCVLCRGANGEAYNACGEEIVTMEQVISYMLHADCNIRSKLIEKPIDDGYAFNKGTGINFSKLDNKKMINIGWKQLFTVEDGFKRMMLSYLSTSRRQRS